MSTGEAVLELFAVEQPHASAEDPAVNTPIPGQLATALLESEDSETLNTSFVERMNLTIRQVSASLCRRSLWHSCWTFRLEEHLELLRCHYNFVRVH